jgi:P-type Na+/K+ transporter
LGRIVSRASANIQSQNQLKRIHTTESDAPLTGSLDGHYEMLVEHPFDSTIKRMSTVWEFIPEDTQHDPADYDLIVCEYQMPCVKFSPFLIMI